VFMTRLEKVQASINVLSHFPLTRVRGILMTRGLSIIMGIYILYMSKTTAKFAGFGKRVGLL